MFIAFVVTLCFLYLPLCPPRALSFSSFHARHPLKVGVLANLESMGAGGRFHVFQCNSARVASSLGKAFQRAGRAGASGGTGSGRGHPFGSVIGSEIFSAVLSKSAATDYRSFLEFGPPGLVGFDTAYIENGHVYHTVIKEAKEHGGYEGVL